MDYIFFQGCTIGGDKGFCPRYPKTGKNVILYSNSTIVGDITIGDNVIISTGTTIVNEKIVVMCLGILQI